MSFLARRATAAVPRFARPFSATIPRPVAKITIVGNLAATPELKATSTGRELVEYAVASNSGPKDKRVTSWFRVTSFVEEGPRRDFMTSIPKGSTVFVQGNATIRTYQDAEGNNRTALNIVQSDLEVLKRPQPQSEEGEHE
ncbi:uncharacterized protein BCR38DRAFT_334273 [Pseudomassariella vexata]|uniref:Single-stranded DNA-binding protein n=1 Tax=Pseudomassariella vexata TaxID=1141098 RepID=A0A1Y2EDV1_9PEZI|nr:uncharacterized protein BCR38DRAFT_334273 [Pseudomassariella vexata]ORY69758.1 hypothetical protein BCR38DRAFT_334273 [Pseudomassariella vexata]